MDKPSLVKQLAARLASRHERAIAALADAAEGATGEDTRAESKYDTRGLESSYLAAGQAEQADELAREAARLEAFEFRDFDLEDPIGPGALVETDRDGEPAWFLLAPAGGGITLETDDGETVTVLGPSAPLRAILEGKTTGDTVPESGIAILEVM